MTKINSQTADQDDRTSRSDWLKSAMEILTSEGVENLKIMELAKRLGVSRSSFYWFFKDREDLLGQLLDYWENKNSRCIIDHAGRSADTIAGAVLNVFECWVSRSVFDPQLDFAVREWARRSDDVRQRLDEADTARVGAITEMFELHGYDPDDAFTRARVLYFMQIGYYALVDEETIEQRLYYVGHYVRNFTGTDATKAELERFRKFALSNASGPVSGMTENRDG